MKKGSQGSWVLSDPASVSLPRHKSAACWEITVEEEGPRAQDNSQTREAPRDRDGGVLSTTEGTYTIIIFQASSFQPGHQTEAV